MQPLLEAAFGLMTTSSCEDLAIQVADFLPPPLDPIDLEHLLAQLDLSDTDATRAIRALAQPESACPGCVREARSTWPAGATSRSCAQHAMEYTHQATYMRRQRQQRAMQGRAMRQPVNPGHRNLAEPATQIAEREQRARRRTSAAVSMAQTRTPHSAQIGRLIDISTTP